MKKYILATLFLGMFVLLLEPTETLMSNFLRIEQPTVHKVENGDWLSKIALEYYGDPSFWKELELINRAPEGDLVFPGEKVIVPSFKVIQQIRSAKKLSKVNRLIQKQQNILASSSSQNNNYQEDEEAQSEKIATVTAQKPYESDTISDVGRIVEFEKELTDPGDEEGSLKSSIPLVGVVVFGLGFVIAIFYVIRKKQKDEVSYYGADLDAAKSEPEKSIYLDAFGEDKTQGEDESNIQAETEKKKMQLA